MLGWLEDGAQLVLLPDGYPARLVNDEIAVHPLHGRYVLQDLLHRFASDRSEELRVASQATADAIIGRAEPRGDWLEMWYEPHIASAMTMGRRHMSGLPQAYYASLLARLGAMIGSRRYLEAADRFFAPLAAPVGEGGLLHLGPPGPTLAMAPLVPRDWVLNGWLSMLVATHSYGELRSRPTAQRLVASNIVTLESVISAFDAPAQRLSRYTLGGMLLVKIGMSEGWAEARLHRARSWIPDEPVDVPLEVTREAGWTPRWVEGDVELVPESDGVRPLKPTPRLVVKLSRAPIPRPNELRFAIDTPRRLTVRLEAFVGSFDPLRSSMVDRSWVEIRRQAVGPGMCEVTFDLPYQVVDLSSYPTNFGRRFNGQQTNTYHATHVVRLRQLAAITGSRPLDTWAKRWRTYVDEWSTIEAYRGFRCWSPEGEI